MLSIHLVSIVFGTVPSLHQSYFIFNDFYTCFIQVGQDTVGSLASLLIASAKARARSAGRARERLWGYYCARALRTKWRLGHPETPVELSVSLFDSLATLFVAKDQARLVLESIGV